jgi:hypothetical protein
MHKILFIGTLLICSGLVKVSAVELPAPHAKPEISLTLIPPSLVTDQIQLDIRGAVRNDGDAPKKFDVAVYLDETNLADRLHQATLEVSAKSSAGFQFRWPTKGKAGRHRMILTAQSGDTVRRLEQAIEIVASDARSSRRLGGAWVDIYHHCEREGRPFNKEFAQLTEPEWRELVRAMHEVDQNLIVITGMFRNHSHVRPTLETYPGQAYYSSKLYSARVPIATEDPLEVILSEADRLGMYVMSGIGNFAWFDFGTISLEWHKRVADEIWERYGHHPSFYGWYIGDEKPGNLGNAEQRKEIVAFFKEFTPYVRRLAPDKPVLLATNPMGLRGAEPTYRQLLPNVDILGPFGFHRMPRNDLTGEQAALLLQSLCDEAGTHLFLDLETFIQKNGPELHPRPIAGLISDFKRFPNFEFILHYQFPGLMSSPKMSRQPGGAPSVKLYEDYQKYLKGGEDAYLVNPLTKNAKLMLGRVYSPMYPGGGDRALVDGITGQPENLVQAWQGYHGENLDATIDLGAVQPAASISLNTLKSIGGIYPPREVEFAVSEDGVAYRPLQTTQTDDPDPSRAVFIKTFSAQVDLGRVRFIRVRARNVGTIPDGELAAGKPAWLFVDEIVVNPSVKK